MHSPSRPCWAYRVNACITSAASAFAYRDLATVVLVHDGKRTHDSVGDQQKCFAAINHAAIEPTRSSVHAKGPSLDRNAGAPGAKRDVIVANQDLGS